MVTELSYIDVRYVRIRAEVKDSVYGYAAGIGRIVFNGTSDYVLIYIYTEIFEVGLYGRRFEGLTQGKYL